MVDTESKTDTPEWIQNLHRIKYSEAELIKGTMLGAAIGMLGVIPLLVLSRYAAVDSGIRILLQNFCN